MTLGISIPSPTARGSPASDDSSSIHTPVSPSFAELPQNASASGNSSKSGPSTGNKRKPSRRANTAERRATHNAVERARRETLNGRFLDLAALLPNLSQIRRPSKSAIVNSSIAHVHASRRHRQLASRELRLLKLEADALRRELNEWRDRAAIPRVQEPARGDGFSMVLSGEIEILPVPELDDEEGDYPYAEEETAPYPGGTPTSEQEAYEFNASQMNPNVHQNIPHRPPSGGFEMPIEQQMMRRPSGPMVAAPAGMAVDNPAMGIMYNGMGGVSYPTSFAVPDMNQGKWGPGPNVNEQDIISRRSSIVAGSDVRRGRDRAMSASSSGSGAPYYEAGWNPAMGGMPPNMGPNMGMMSGGGSMGNGGAAFARMM